MGIKLNQDPEKSFKKLFPKVYDKINWSEVKNLGLDNNKFDLYLPSSRNILPFKCSDCEYAWNASPRTMCRRKANVCMECFRLTEQGKVSVEESIYTTHRHVYDDINKEELQNNIIYKNINPQNLSSGSGIKLPFKCIACEYEWVTTVASRCAGYGCKKCAFELISKIKGKVSVEKSIYTTHRNVYDEIDQEEFKNNIVYKDINLKYISYGSSLKIPFKCKDCHHKWVTTVHARCGNGQGCNPCAQKRNKEKMGKRSVEDSFYTTHRDIYDQINKEEFKNNEKFKNIDPKTLGAGSGVVLPFICSDCGHEWEAQIYIRAIKGCGCKPCSIKRAAIKMSDVSLEQSIYTTHRSVCDEIDKDEFNNNPIYKGLDPKKIIAGSDKVLPFECSKCHRKWATAVKTRCLKGGGCKKCSDASVNEASLEDSIYTTHRSVYDEIDENELLNNPKYKDLDPKKISAGSGKNLPFECAVCHHKWDARVGTRCLRNAGCKRCKDKESMRIRSIATLEESIYTKFPVIYNEIDQDELKNNPKYKGINPIELKPGSSTRLPFECSKCHFKWEASLCSRTATSTGEGGCKHCSKYGFDPSRESSCYIFWSTNKKEIKHGISHRPKTRLTEIRKSNFEHDFVVIFTATEETGYRIEEFEKRTKKILKRAERPKGFKSDGYTEIYPVSELPLLIKMLKEENFWQLNEKKEEFLNSDVQKYL